MKRFVSAITLVFSSAVSIAACAIGGQDDDGVILRRDPPSRVSGSLGQDPGLKTEDLSAVERSAVDLAVAGLQQQINLGGAAIELGGIRPVEWSDSSLGCPQPGMSYLQVITPGYRVILEVNGKEHSVHVGGQRAVVCDRAVHSGPSRSRVGDIQRLEALAKDDLSRKLNVPLSSIKRQFVEPAKWPDTRLGCEGRGDDYDTGETTGFVFGLNAGGRLYTYHTDMDRIFACPEIATE